MMDRMENDLREALRRKEPPAGFAARVLAAAESQAARRPSGWNWLRPQMRWAVASLACILILAAGMAIRQQREREMRARGEAAKQQVMLALRITSAKLHVAQAKVTGRTHTENRI